MAKRPRGEVIFTDAPEVDLPPSSKHTHLEEGTPPPTEDASVMRCSLPPHPETLHFPSYEAYDIHYAQHHVNRCSECARNFPTNHFLELHIEENHDPLNEARQARGDKIYGCFVEGCDRKCSAPRKRKRHLIDKHMFPKDYDFLIVDHGMDRRSSMLRSARSGRRRSSAAIHAPVIQPRARKHVTRRATKEADRGGMSEEPTKDGSGASDDEDDNSSEDEAPAAQKGNDDAKVPAEETADGAKDVRELTDSLAALRFVPPRVRFGKGGSGSSGRKIP
ncbi:MAG: hypothetical protein M1838_003432 [Thelocarpon superellum]|nr:MAG: hypothetical protein M1838_003432 [Thelocarpon superellum]